jgi:hypothetical protein
MDESGVAIGDTQPTHWSALDVQALKVGVRAHL